MRVQRILKALGYFTVNPAFVLALVSVLCTACWDTIQHVYACNEDNVGTDLCNLGTTTDTGSSTADVDTDSQTADKGNGQGLQPQGWEGIGSPCVDDADCQAIDSRFLCIHSVIDLIGAPGGYCTACCNQSGKDACATGIDCVGADGVYLVCISHCTSNSQCRAEDGWVCREMYYISNDFPGDFCMPDTDHATPDTDHQGEMPDCDWPWLND
jgi:hypothetical protein